MNLNMKQVIRQFKWDWVQYHGLTPGGDRAPLQSVTKKKVNASAHARLSACVVCEEQSW